MASPPHPRVALIAAVARNGIIGKNGTLPWHLPDDLKHFKALTLGKRIVMGRRTWQSFPKPLPGREHVVVTSQALSLPEGVHRVSSLAAALAMPNPTAPVFIIGGNALYAEALNVAHDLYLTEIDADFEGDTSFPKWNRELFSETRRDTHDAVIGVPARSVSYSFVHYVRR